MPVIDDLRASREVLNKEIGALLEAAIPTEATEAQAANAVIKEKQTARKEIDDRVADLLEEQTRREADQAGSVRAGAVVNSDGQPVAHVGAEPRTYHKGNSGRTSYFHDLTKATLENDPEARGRLQRHAMEMDVDIPARSKAGKASVFEKMGDVRGAFSPGRSGSVEQLANPNRTDGTGGYFVPPVWLIDEFIPFLRAGRVTADLCFHQDLPGGTDSINLPKVNTGSLAAFQSDGGAVASQDITDISISAPVRTVAGQQDVAMQLIDQSPISFDVVVMKDLTADYNKQLDIGVLAGAGTGNTLTGLANVTGINAVTFTSGSPTVPLLYVPGQQAQSLIAKLRFAPATAFLVHPSLWYWIASALDSQNRPLVPPTGGPNPNPVNLTVAGTNVVDVAQGYTGTFGGLPVYMDANVPTNIGASSNQSVIYAAKWDDLYLYEGSIRSRVLTEVLSGTLQVRIQLYNYVAFLPNRFPAAISAVNGTGLVVQSGY